MAELLPPAGLKDALGLPATCLLAVWPGMFTFALVPILHGASFSMVLYLFILDFCRRVHTFTRERKAETE